MDRPSSVMVRNCTFYDNGAITSSVDGALGGAIFARNSAAVIVENSIFRSNNPGDIFGVRGGGSVNISSSITSGNPRFLENPDGKNNGWTDDPTTGTNEAANNDYGDLRLASNSPAINAGDNAEVISATDLDGDRRVRGGIVDQGAYESRFAQYFVDASAASSGTGLSWGEAVRTLAELPIDGGEAEIRLAQGTYVVPDGGFELGSGAWIRGGFNANNGDQNPANNPVVLTGDLNGDDLPDRVNRADNATHVLWSNTASDVTIDGVTISGANSDSLGGGLMLEEVLNLFIVEDNDARRGGGVAIRGGDGVMTDTIVRNNRGSRENGGMRVDGGATMVIQNSEIRDNSSIEECGGAGFYNGANAFVNNTVFTGNTSEIDVGGVEVSNNVGSDPAYVELFNTIITGNSAAGEASGVRYAQDASGVIDQSVITENTALENGVIAVRDDAMLLLRQSTIAGTNRPAATTPDSTKRAPPRWA
ncbi:MAG: choice-of-anchor Q domain-containing protein [Planctomycetota bacterium]